MKNYKKTLSLVIALAFVWMSIGAVYGDVRTAKFTDINTSWAKQNIINVYNKGLMDGITDTVFKPGDNVKNYDVLISIARMMIAAAPADLNALEAKYKDKVLDKFKVPQYARKEVAYCLEKGIISDFDVSAFTDDVKSTTKKAYASKKDVCLYLGRAFGVTVKADAPPIVFAFKDAMFIPTVYKPYVDFLIKNGIVSEKGDAKGNFNPESIITRDVFAKMIDLSNTLYQKTKGGKDTSANTNPTNTNTNTNTGTNSNTNTNTGGTTTPPTTNTGSTISSEIEGYLMQVIPEYGTIILNVKGANGTLTKKVYKVADKVTCTIDNAAGYYWKIKEGDTVKLTLSGDKAVKLEVTSKIRKFTGILNEIEITDKTSVVITTDKGEVKKFVFTDKTAIIKDAKPAALDDLKKGNKIAIITDNENLTEVNADGMRTTDQGTIEAVTYSRTAAPRIILVQADGSKVEYYIANNIKRENIIIEGQVSEIYDVRPGMQVTVDLENEDIVKIVSIAPTTSVNIEATVKYVNTRVNVITIEIFDAIENKLIEKKVFAANAKIANKKLATLALSDLKKGQKIIIIGTEDIDGIAADTIIADN